MDRDDNSNSNSNSKTKAEVASGRHKLDERGTTPSLLPDRGVDAGADVGADTESPSLRSVSIDPSAAADQRKAKVQKTSNDGAPPPAS